ncbi:MULTISPECIES: helix-turn-helix transcriptional regulator [Cohnella]|uniref:helix-turn-helix transcriptional regulator n=1 Tax=Cohnella TaxID=329857 RepID=UPI000E3772A5|nr:helix-turn-helix domain-containing protein [Cohnella sp.]REK65013.1 MAG: AraC family transcriptional regulator [Cohnella sp.]
MPGADVTSPKYHILERSFTIQYLHKNGSYSMNRAHFHPFYEIYYLLKGERVYFINGSVYTVNKGDLIVINPHDLHRTDNSNADSNGFERILINFTHDFIMPNLDGELPLLPFKGDSHLIRFPLKEQASIENMLWELMAECKEQQAGHAAVVRALLVKLLIRIYRFQLQALEEPSRSPNPMHRKISEIASYLAVHFHEKPTLDQVAKQFFISPSHLSRVFKSVTGFYFREYLLLLRIREAQKQLRETHHKVQTIAESCGFENLTHFNKSFKKIIGLSPLQYRKRSKI